MTEVSRPQSIDANLLLYWQNAEKKESSYQELIAMDSSLQQLSRTIEATQLQVKSLLSGYHTKRDHLAHLYLSHRLMKV